MPLDLQTSKRRTFGLFIGIENYRYGPKRVPSAEKDAKDVYDAYVALGANPHDLRLLLGAEATAGTMEAAVKEVCASAEEEDEVVIFFAGHGLLDGRTYLASVESNLRSIPQTSLSLEDIAFYVKSSRSKRVITFLDACHSGVELPDHARDTLGSFSEDELRAFFESAEYRVGFASCRSDQKSYSSKSLGNGIWTYFLLKALRGEVPEILDGGRLLSGSLQDYLRKYVPSQVVAENGAAVVQIPHVYGLYSGTFVVADLTLLLAQKLLARRAAANSIRDIQLVGSSEGFVKKLSGWRKGHFLPKANRAGEQFFAQLCQGEVESESEEFFQKLRRIFRYKPDDITLSVESPGASIITPDFTFSLTYVHDGNEADSYTLHYQLTNIANPTALQDEDFNRVMDRIFDTVSLTLENENDVKELVKKLDREGGFDLDWPSDFSFCDAKRKGVEATLKILPYELQFRHRGTLKPSELMRSFESDVRALAESSSLSGLLLT